MNQEELNKRQEAIAVLMGIEKKFSKTFDHFYYDFFEKGKKVQVIHMEYNSNMSWLYPVCQKINDVFSDDKEVIVHRIKMGEALESTQDISEIFLHASDFAMAYNELK